MRVGSCQAHQGHDSRAPEPQLSIDVRGDANSDSNEVKNPDQSRRTRRDNKSEARYTIWVYRTEPTAKAAIVGSNASTRRV